MSIVLGIHDGHNASAALIADGEVVAAVAEERVTRRKNSSGFPHGAIAAVLDLGAIDACDLDAVALASEWQNRPEWFDAQGTMKAGPYEARADRADAEARQRRLGLYRTERMERASHLLGGRHGTTLFRIDHHSAHAAAAFYSSPHRDDDVAVVTMDGSGDGLCATVSVSDGGKLRRIRSSPATASWGKIVARTTALLGFRPWEHEYKLMGLAPYVDQDRCGDAYEVLAPMVWLDGLEFRTHLPFGTSYAWPHLAAGLEGIRFDHVAAALQLRTEQLVVEFVAAAAKAVGTRTVCLGGGVAMNVKANQLATARLDHLYVCPSAGDESLAIGAAYLAAVDLGDTPEPLGAPYLGRYTGPTAKVADEARRKGFRVEQVDDPNQALLERLLGGEIVGRCTGRAEWGARALGHRSVLMDAARADLVPRLNDAIKHRDFWMPFAPSMTATAAAELLHRPGGSTDDGWMMVAADTTPRGRELLAAAIHPRDGSARPQVVDARHDVHLDLVTRFESCTGRPLLNTSLNIHGDPMVDSAADAFDVLVRSKLDAMVIDDVVITR